jgi:hypothetical protein
MAWQIEDGKGKGSKAGVSSDNRLDTSSRSNSRSFYISRDEGSCFSLSSHDATAAAGTYIAYFKNNSPTKNFYVDFIEVGGVETALWKVWSVTGTAAGGSAITPSNLNLTSGNVADATARGNDSITGLTTVSQLGTLRTSANSDGLIEYNDTLILGTNDAIAVEYDTGTTGVAEVFIRGYFE